VPYPGLNLLQARLMESRATVIIPFDNGILIISALNGTNFSIRLSEVSQTLDAVSGIQFLLSTENGAKRRPLGTVGVRDRARVGQWRLGSFTQFGHPLVSDMGHRVQHSR
jgi:hypothetical protein